MFLVWPKLSLLPNPLRYNQVPMVTDEATLAALPASLKTLHKSYAHSLNNNSIATTTPQPVAVTILLSISKRLTTSNTSYGWNHISPFVTGLFHLV